MLVKADVAPVMSHTFTLPAGHHKCGSCNICPLTIETKHISLPDVGLEHDLTAFSNCKTLYVIYMLECFCPKRYVGSTQRQLKIRIQEHISRIKRTVTSAPVAQHFVDMKHACNEFKVVVLKVVHQNAYQDRSKLLLQREVFWTHRLNALHSNGLNNETEYNVFL